MATHKHAALMQQYAKDWAETEEPWKRWEVTSHRSAWVALCGHPYWKAESEYRRKPRTLTYTVTIPEPMREVPWGSWYWLAEATSDDFTLRVEWEGDSCDHSWLKRGLCFATREDAIAAAKAMLPIKGEEA